MIGATEPLLQAILRNMRIWQVVHDIVPLSEAVTSDILSPQDLRNLLPSSSYLKCGTYMRIRIPIESEFLDHTTRAMFPLGDRESWIRAWYLHVRYPSYEVNGIDRQSLPTPRLEEWLCAHPPTTGMYVHDGARIWPMVISKSFRQIQVICSTSGTIRKKSPPIDHSMIK